MTIVRTMVILLLLLGFVGCADPYQAPKPPPMTPQSQSQPATPAR